MRRYYKFFVSLFLLVFVGFFIYRLVTQFTPVQAEWFNDSWAFRNAIPISSHTTGETKVYIIATLNIGSTLNTRTNAGDIRVTTSSGKIIPYYIASGVGTTAIVLHIYIDNFPAGAQTFYAYYGNPYAINGFNSADFTTVATGYVVGTLGAQELSKGPVAYWKFDEGFGTTTADSTTNQYNASFGTGNSAPSWTTEDMCISGKCLYLYNGDYLSVGSTISNIKTVSLWIKPTAVGTSFFNLNSTTYLTVDSSGIVTAPGFSSPTIYVNGIVTSKLNTNQWQHLVITTATPLTGDSIFIGKSGTSFLNGYLDEIKVYTYPLSASQVNANYNSKGNSLAKGANTILGSNNQNSNAFSQGLVAWWKMDENTGTTTVDSSGNNNLGTFGPGSSAPSWNTGKFGVGTTYNGSTTYISIGSTINNIQTITIWYYPTDTGPAFLEFNTSTNIGASAATVYTTGISSPSIYIDGLQSTSIGTTNTWHHLVVTSTSPITGSLIKFGKAGNLFLNGRLDEIRLYNRIFSPAEVQYIYNWAPGPVGYWNLNEGTGTTVHDLSGNGNNGDFYSYSKWVQGKVGKALQSLDEYFYINAGPTSFLTGVTTFTNSLFIYPTQYPPISRYSLITRGYYLALDGTSWTFSLLPTKVLEFNAEYPSGRLSCKSTSTIPLNRWSFVSMVWTGTNTCSSVSFYINGILDKTISVSNGSGTFNAYNEHVILGNSMDSVYSPKGILDEIRIYNYARTAKQIVEDMNAGNSNSSTNSMIAYYNFNEGYGNITQNSGNGGIGLSGIFGTGNSAPGWTNDSVYGKALSFDGSKTYLSIGQTINSIQTISFWLKPGGITNNNFLTLSSGVNIGATGNTLFATGFTSPNFYVNGIGTSRLTNNTWQHIVISTGTTVTGNSIIIGKNGNNFFTGNLDEVKIYNYSLTASDAKLDYNRGLAVNLGALSQSSGSTAPATSQSQAYCVPGDSTACTSPMGEWGLNEGIGTSAYDTSGNSYNGTLTSGPTWVTGKIGKAVNFTGSENISLVNGASAKNLNQVTLEAWFYVKTLPLNANYLTIYYEPTADVSNSTRLSLFVTNNTQGCTGVNVIGLRFRVGISTDTAYSACGTTAISANTWYHVTGIFNSVTGVHDVYLNGLKDGTKSQVIGAFANTNPIVVPRIGRTDASAGFVGQIDEVKIYNYARTPAQIALDYDRGQPLMWYKLDECQGSVANDSINIGSTATITIGAGGSQVSLGTCAIGATTAWGVGASGKFNASLNFDGTDDYLSTGTTNSQIYSVSFWAKPSAVGTSIAALNATTFISADSNGTVSAIGFSTPVIYINNNTNTNLKNNSWNHIVVTTTSSVNTTAISFAKVSTKYFAGQLDDIRLFNYPLTSTQVKTLYNGNFAVNFSPSSGSP